MRIPKSAIVLSLLAVLLSIGTTIAQMKQCPDIVQTALRTVDELCADTGRNEMCYGNAAIEAYPQADISSFVFNTKGDIEDVGKLQVLQLVDLDASEGVWGIALMRLQANIPDSLPGQNVTFLLFGDVAIAPADPIDDSNPSVNDPNAPMQAFYLRTGIGATQCNEAPQSGLLVQTPDGIDEVAFNINGVDVALGSTVFFQAAPQREMVVSTIEGSAMMRIGDTAYPVIAGTRLRLPIDGQMRPVGRPNLPEAYTNEDVNPLPIGLLQREIRIREPLTNEALKRLHERLETGEAPCDIEGLPDCVDISPVMRRLNMLGAGDTWSRDAGVYRLFDGRECAQQRIGLVRRMPLCDNILGTEEAEIGGTRFGLPIGSLPIDNRPCVYRPRPEDPPLPPEETRPFCEDDPEASNPPTPMDRAQED
ncbi:MAG: hypothetical protein CL607_03415 [Anaerolineaceae bacterium]|nr:hypothetical protein [Anaerolineaceae bacterium]